MRNQTQRLLNQVARPEVYEETLITSNGVPIALSIWKARPDDPCLVFLPATMTHPLFYEEFLDALALAGFNVVGVHFQNHGKSPRLKRLYSFDDMVQNARDAAGYARQRFGTPPIILGTSQGGLVAMAVAGDNSKVQAVFAHNILDANDAESLSITRFPRWLKPYYSLLQKSMRLGAKLLPRLSLPIGFYLQDSRIFREKSLLEQFYQDPLNLTAYPLYFLASLFSADTGFLSAGKIKCPVVVISASGDTLFSRSYTQRVFQRIVAPSRQMLEFELNNHLIFNECLEEILPGLLDKLREYAQAQQETGFSI